MLKVQALDILKDKLLGNFISRFSVGDTWDLSIGNYWLIAQDISSSDEAFLNGVFKDSFRHYDSTVDKDYISKCAIVAAAMRREIINVELDKLCSLEIKFDNDFKLLIPTNAAIVDWQWCLNETGADPYRDCLVACFWEGEILIGENKD